MNKENKKIEGLEEIVVVEDNKAESTFLNKIKNIFDLHKKALIIGMIVIGLIGGSGAAFMAIEEYNEDKPVDTSTLKISKTQAEKIAIGKMSGGSVAGVKVDREDGRIVYEVEGKKDNNDYKFEIDANTGKIVEEKIKNMEGLNKSTDNNIQKTDSSSMNQEKK